MQRLSKALFFLLPLLVLIAQLAPSYALLLGLAFGLIFSNPFPKRTKNVTKYLLQAAIVGLGFGLNFGKVMEAGREGFLYTLTTIVIALILGFLFGRLLKVERKIAYLISCGTAICGGSAIAAVSQVLKSDEKDISVSIGTVFILNAVALFLFPAVGEYFHMSQQQFGIWSAIAIHDTSSVVGAASRYGNDALMIATTIKLARALWIIPLVIFTALIFREKNFHSTIPWFIFFFVIASLINSYTSLSPDISLAIVKVAKIGFSLTLYLIGTGISIEALRKVGVRPLLQGVLLWIAVSLISFALVMH